LEAEGYEVRRLEGSDRFATAAAVAAEVGASPASEVALTLGRHDIDKRAWPDALSAGALAATAGLPTLLTHGDRLPVVTEQALAGLGTERVLVIGGLAAIGQAVADRLEELGYEVVRLHGEDRYATSAAVGAEALKRTTATQVPVVFATGDNYPDGLAATALAARIGGIVVLVNGKDDALHTGIDGFLRANAARLTGGVVVGGTAVVSEAIRSQLEAAMTG
ncbi:MAG TPA: cell wall-binding repeat-containing protein, partial [Nitriliruptorales bacterium]